MNIQSGDGIGALLTTAFNMIKPALPKIASTIGLAGLSTVTQCDHFQQSYNRRNVKVHVPIIRWSHCEVFHMLLIKL